MLYIESKENKYDLSFTKELLKLYQLYTTEIFPSNPKILKGFENNTEIIYKRHNQHFNIKTYEAKCLPFLKDGDTLYVVAK